MRKVINFNTKWLYLPEDNSDMKNTSFDDTVLEMVCVPHANKVIEGHKGDDFQKHIESYRFVSWYRKHFTVEDFKDKRIVVEFEGVATLAEVYVNSRFVGEHKGAYTSFSFDITDYVMFDKENVISVRVDSTKRKDIPPEGHNVDYCLFGGIVRNVNMIVTNKEYIKDAFITTPVVNHEYAIVKAMVDFEGEATVVMEVCDNDGNQVAVAEGVNEITTDKIINPILWDVEHPYLYTVKLTLLKDGETVDIYQVKTGFRWFEFKAEENDGRFYLNGEKFIIRGVNRHEQWPWQGRAVPDKLQIKDADMIKDTGFNAVRCSHYPQSPAFLNRCDEIGLIVFEEAPGWQHIGDEAWQEVYKGNIREMILRDRNHPSIITWGVRVNESQDNRELYTKTKDLAKKLDPTRPSHGVRMMELYETTEHVEDIFCNNYVYPEKPRFLPFVITEHSMDWWEGNGYPDAIDEKAMKFTKSFGDAVDYYYGNDLCAGGFAWSMFDYNNEVNYTKTGHVFYSGMYDLYRFDKPVSHLYRAQKSTDDEIVLYIASYWTENSPSAVEVYSNCDEVELFVNGISKGRITPNLYKNLPHPAFRFENVAFEEGTLEAVGYINKDEVKRSVNKTPLKAAKLILEPDYSTLVCDGSDMTQVSIKLVDENGTRMPYADNLIEIAIDGCAEFIGEKSVRLEGGRMAFIVKSIYNKTGDVICTVKSDGIESASCIINVR